MLALRSLALLAVVLAGCGAATEPPVSTATPPSASQLPSASPAPASASTGPEGSEAVPATGFAFDAESVLGYYLSVGFACDLPERDAASGHTTQVCTLLDGDGRIRTIGLETDPDGELVRGFASLGGAPGEVFPDPVAALEPLAGFFGAMLGPARGTDLVPWLAGHLGDPYAETTSADLHVATSAETSAGQTVLFVEVASPMAVVTPGPSPG